MKLKQYWQSVKTAFYTELSWSVLTWSSVCGIWIAFCPFLGLHTMLVFVCSWLFSLNVAVVLGLSVLINNPWTMLPVYYFDYQVGMYLYFYTIGQIPENPFWLQFVLIYMQKNLLIPSFSFWAFMIGGLFVATAAAVITYSFFIGYGFFKTDINAKDKV